MSAVHQHLRDYHDVARRSGYRYRRFALGDAADADVVSHGLLEVDEPQPGLRLTCSDVTLSHQAEAEAEIPPGLLIGLSVAGRVEGWVEGGGALAAEPGEASALQFNRAAGFRSVPQPGPLRHRTVSLFVQPDWLEQRGFGAALLADPAALVAWRRWSPSLHLRGLIEQCLVPDRDDPLLRLRKEIVALELLSDAIARLTPRPQSAHELRPAEHARMMRVRDLLLAAPEADHSLADLARAAGVSLSVLKEHFPRAFGQSVFSYLRELRLERAHRGLTQEGWTVMQAAYHAGYRHPTNFAAAFRRRFGVSPKRLRP